MPTNKKRKQKAPQPVMSGFNHFVKDMHEVLKRVDFDKDFLQLPRAVKERMYEVNFKILNPEAGNEHISRKELEYFMQETKKKYREGWVKLGEETWSLYELQLCINYLRILRLDDEDAIAQATDEEITEIDENLEVWQDAFFNGYLGIYLRIITRLNNPEVKSYSIAGEFFNSGDRLTWYCKIYGIPAQKCMVSIDAVKRPVYRLCNSSHKINEWTFVEASLLGNFYKGCQPKLDVYLQSHVMVQMRKRLDVLDQEAINYALWENTYLIEEIENHNDFLLVPFQLYGVKVGYLVARIMEDKFILVTFLFITLNSTPEGIRLKRLTGLGKEDISYWKIDRLSTFLNLREEDYPRLIPIFNKAGLGDLMQLKDKEFTTESMQASNLNGLTDYIYKGKREYRLMTKSLEVP